MRCPACGSESSREFARATDVEYGTSPDEFRYFECLECGSVFLEDPPVTRLEEIYPRSYYSYHDATSLRSPFMRVKEALDVRLFKRIIRGLGRPGVRVLDVGGGSGWLLSMIRRHCPEVAETHVVDIDGGARKAAEAADHVFHEGRVEDFDSADRFDLILMLNLIEHVQDPGRVLAAMRRLVSAEGRILIKTPNPDTLDRRLFQGTYWGGLHCPRHWVLFTRPAFESLARRKGLDCVESRYTQGGPQWAVSLLAWMQRRGLVDMGGGRPVDQQPLLMPLAAVGAAFDFARMPFAPTAQMIFILRPGSGAPPPPPGPSPAPGRGS